MSESLQRPPALVMGDSSRLHEISNNASASAPSSDGLAMDTRFESAFRRAHGYDRPARTGSGGGIHDTDLPLSPPSSSRARVMALYDGRYQMRRMTRRGRLTLGPDIGGGGRRIGERDQDDIWQGDEAQNLSQIQNRNQEPHEHEVKPGTSAGAPTDLPAYFVDLGLPAYEGGTHSTPNEAGGVSVGVSVASPSQALLAYSVPPIPPFRSRRTGLQSPLSRRDGVDMPNEPPPPFEERGTVRDPLSGHVSARATETATQTAATGLRDAGAPSRSSPPLVSSTPTLTGSRSPSVSLRSKETSPER